MRLLRKLGLSSGATQHIDPTLPINPEPDDAHAKQYAVSEAQWTDTFQESLRDFELKFTEEEIARSMEERARQDEFDHTMANFRDTFLKNDLQRRELYKETDALEEERFQKADAAREAIFVQGKQDRARAFESDQEWRMKRAEWYSGVRKELLSDGRQRLTKKYDTLNVALLKQFGRLMERRKEIMEVAEEQSSLQDTLIPVTPDGDSEPVNSQSVTPSSPLTKSPSSSSSTFAEYLYFHPQQRSTKSDEHLPQQTSTESNGQEYLVFPPQPTSTKYNDQQVTQISQSPSQSMRSLSHSSSSPNPESLSSLTQPTSPESNDQQEQSPHLVEQGDPEGSTHSAEVEEDKFTAYFMRSQEKRQKKFLQDESRRDHQFRASEAARDAGESKRSTIFDQQIKYWSWKSQTHHHRGQRQGHFRRGGRRSIAFQNAEKQHWTVFDMSMSYIEEQAKAEAESEDIYFQRQKDMILELYKSQAIQLNQRNTEDQIVWFELMRGRYCRRSSIGLAPSRTSLVPPQPGMHTYNRIPILSQPDTGFGISAIWRGSLIQKALPIPKITNGQEPFAVSNFQRIFEQSQGLRAEAFQKGAKERNHTFTINEARRETEFVKIQWNRKEIFDQAEELRESEFEEAQHLREFKFQAHEQELEDRFHQMQMERNGQARRAQEFREQKFQSTMTALHQKCFDDEKRRLEELERFGEELLMRREPGLESLNID